MLRATDILELALSRDRKWLAPTPLDELRRLLGLVEPGTGSSEAGPPSSDLEAERRTFELLDGLTHAEFDTLLDDIRTRDLTQRSYPLVHLDVIRGTTGTRVCAVATGVSAQGRVEPLGLLPVEVDDGWFWNAFLDELVRQGLHGVTVVVSADWPELRQAVAGALPDAQWWRADSLDDISHDDALLLAWAFQPDDPLT